MEEKNKCQKCGWFGSDEETKKCQKCGSKQLVLVPACQYCDKPATRNIQEVMIEWSINKKGKYGKNHTILETGMNDDYNYHLCDNCEPKW